MIAPPIKPAAKPTPAQHPQHRASAGFGALMVAVAIAAAAMTAMTGLRMTLSDAE